jgi:hypothetical protein
MATGSKCAYFRHEAGVTVENALVFAGCGVPDTDGVVEAGAGEENLAMVGECAYAADRVAMAAKGALVFPGGGVPDPDGVVGAGACQQNLIAAGESAYAGDGGCMTAQGKLVVSARSIPDPYRGVVARTGEQDPMSEREGADCANVIGMTFKDGVFGPRHPLPRRDSANPNAHQRLSTSARGAGQRNGAAVTPSGTPSTSRSSATSRSGSVFSTAAAHQRRCAGPAALGNATHTRSRTVSPSAVTCLQVRSRKPSMTTAVPSRSAAVPTES